MFIFLLSFFLSSSTLATTYAQLNLGFSSSESTDKTLKLSGSTYGGMVGKRFGFLGIEVGTQIREISLDDAESTSYEKLEYKDNTLFFGLRFFLTSFFSVSFGSTGVSSDVTINDGTGEDEEISLPSRSGSYAEAGLRFSGKRGALFISYRRDSIDPIESTSLPHATKVESNESYIIGFSANIDQIWDAVTGK